MSTHPTTALAVFVARMNRGPSNFGIGNRTFPADSPGIGVGSHSCRAEMMSGILNALSLARVVQTAVAFEDQPLGVSPRLELDADAFRLIGCIRTSRCDRAPIA